MVVIVADTTDRRQRIKQDVNIVSPASRATSSWADRRPGLVRCNGTGTDAGEVGVAGATVKLIGAGADNAFGTGDDVTLATTTTDANGICSPA